ncbi:MAG TPA: hypothetical protein VH144_00895 [Candidatus Saccharimonadales bacterium]|nr:hypothetical protein [Candidatus Saccharimonadales bacterium]
MLIAFGALVVSLVAIAIETHAVHGVDQRQPAATARVHQWYHGHMVDATSVAGSMRLGDYRLLFRRRR